MAREARRPWFSRAARLLDAMAAIETEREGVGELVSILRAHGAAKTSGWICPALSKAKRRKSCHRRRDLWPLASSQWQTPRQSAQPSCHHHIYLARSPRGTESETLPSPPPSDHRPARPWPPHSVQHSSGRPSPPLPSAPSAPPPSPPSDHSARSNLCCDPLPWSLKEPHSKHPNRGRFCRRCRRSSKAP